MLARGALAALLLLPSCVLAGFTEQSTSLALGSGRMLAVNLRIPDGPGPHPAVMLFGGFKEARNVLDRVSTDEPILFATFDYPYDPPRKFVFPGGLRHLPAFKRGIGETFEGIAVLHAYLQGRADVDPRRITVCGASVGAPFAIIGAARGNIPGAVIIHGFGELQDVAAHQLIRKYEPRHGRWVRAPARGLIALLSWYLELPRPEDYAESLGPQQKVLMVSAEQDSFIPASARDSLWQALQRSAATVEHQVLPGDHVRGGATEQVADLLTRSLAWMRARGLL